MKTLIEFINEKQGDFPFATGEFSRLVHDIGIAAKIVNREINKAGIADIFGNEGTINIQGEDQKKLDVFANNQFIKALKHGGMVCAIASEENDELITFDNELSNKGKYVVAMDPLDGSSNIEVNVSIGTVFSISAGNPNPENPEHGRHPSARDTNGGCGIRNLRFSTMLVYSTGYGVNGFTLTLLLGCSSSPIPI